LNDNEGAMSFSPDGLTEQVIDELLRKVDAAVAGPRATSALRAGMGAERRQRRMEHRAVAMPVHALPLVSAGLDGWVA
jgi:hypothetical protein